MSSVHDAQKDARHSWQSNKALWSEHSWHSTVATAMSPPPTPPPLYARYTAYSQNAEVNRILKYY